jgi:hypothetical protein
VIVFPSGADAASGDRRRWVIYMCVCVWLQTGHVAGSEAEAIRDIQFAQEPVVHI